MPAPRRPSTRSGIASTPEVINIFPISSRVATSESPRQPSQDTEDFANVGASSSKRAYSQLNVETLRKRLEWVERLCEPSASLNLMREAISNIDLTSYEDLLQERHLMELCPYPPCGRKASLPYQPAQSGSNLKIRFNQGVLFDASDSGQRYGAFCSKKCQNRSDWYKNLIGTERTELLEDVEMRRKEVGRHAIAVSDSPQSLAHHAQDTATPLEKLRGNEHQAMMSQLTIHERPSPPQPPNPPNVHHQVDFERPQTVTRRAGAATTAPPSSRMALSSNSPLRPPTFDYKSLTVPVSEIGLRSSSSNTSNVKSSRQPSEGLAGLPPPIWTSDPIMVEHGQEVEWRKDLDEDSGEDALQIREWLDAALEERARAKQAGEIP